MKTPTCLGLLLLAGPVMLANPAVSDINGKLGVMHGSMDSESTTSLEGSITWPVLESFGIQLDGLYSTMGQPSYGFGNADDSDLGGVGGHFFWRDSETAMLGVEAGYVFGDPVDSWELGIEAEYYYKWLTIGGKAGFASISYDRPAPSIESDKDSFFCQFYLAAYPVDNLLVAAFVENRFDNTYLSIEVEYELPVPGLSVFANAMKGDHDYDHAMVGMRYYFGEDKPLRSRHREDDPRNTLTGIRHGIGTWQADVHEQVVKAANQAPAGSGGTTAGTLSTGGSNSNGGTLTIGSGGGISLGAGGLTLGTGGSIGGSGTIGGQSGGATVIGPGSGTLTGTGTLTLSNGGSLTPGSGTLVLNPQNSGLTLGSSVSTGSSFIMHTGTTYTGSINVLTGTLHTYGSYVPANAISGNRGVSSTWATTDPSAASNWLFSIPQRPESSTP
jgi:hypothetical protein